MQEMEKPRDTFILVRGNFQNNGEKVSAGVPAFLPPLARISRPTASALARWLVSKEQPAHRARDGESLLGDVLRHRTGQDGERFRLAGRMAEPSGIARLAGVSNSAMAAALSHARTVGHASACKHDRDERDLPAERRGDPRTCSSAIPKIVSSPAVRACGSMRNSSATMRWRSRAAESTKSAGRSVKPYQPAGIWDVTRSAEV